MTSRLNELAADLAEIFSEIGSTVEWEGASYQAVIADPMVQLDLQSGGFLPQADFVVKIARRALPSLPQVGQTLRIEAQVYQITGLTNKPTSPLLVLHVARS
jgi:hypothetical protein